ncbi:MAG: GNAT family N-acetyltransferase [Terracidiphilus sp.]|jgi:GNAT superfamily N-acetyltransferase
MIYEFMRPGEEAEVSSLVWDVFEEFEAAEYKQEGIDEFKRFIAPESLAARCAAGIFFVLCCKSGSGIAGVIAIKENHHISLLFVRKEDQRKGIARTLLAKALEACLATDPKLQAVTVNSSRYAVGVYERLGFESIGPEQEKNGIRFTPMRLEVARR